MLSSPWIASAPAQRDREYFATAEMITLKSFLAIPDFLYGRGLLESQLKSATGLQGHSTHTDSAGMRFCIIMVWESEEAFNDFAGSGAYLGLIEVLESRIARGMSARWTVKGSNVPPTLNDASQRFKAPLQKLRPPVRPARR
jgi:hypothetical protein